MKKLFTLAFALLGFAGAANAASEDDLAVLKHSYVLVCDDYTNGNTAAVAKGTLYGDSHFFTPTGHSVAGFNTNGTPKKGAVDLSQVDTLGVDGAPLYVTQYFVDKYGEYGLHNNSLRLKNDQDVLALKLTAKSKVIMFIQGNNKTGKDARIPCIAKTTADIKAKKGLNAAPDENHAQTISGYRWEYTVDDDGLYYIGSYNGDMFVSYIIIEANEAPGTPTVKVSDQVYEGGLWFREVTCKANDMVEEGSTEKIPTIVTYTTDGSAPTAASEKYTGPIKCYKDMTVRFQAFMDFGDGKPVDENIADGADNEGNVNFSFDAPTITANGAVVTVTSAYDDKGGVNWLSPDGSVRGAKAMNTCTLTESASVMAFTRIANGDYGTFMSKTSTLDVYVLNPIKEKKTIQVTAADVVVDAEATAQSTDGSTVYTVENGAISADKADFFVKNLSWGVLKDAKAAYQNPEGQEAYIQMSNTNISFFVAEGDSVDVKVVTTKNSCKTLNPENDESVTTDRKNYVNVNGTTYGHDDVTAEGGTIIEFGLKGAEGGTVYTFQKYSGTGNILISSIEITPVAAAEPADPNNLVKNWDCSGTDVSSFWVHEWRTMDAQTDGPANLVDGCAKVWVRSYDQAVAAGNPTLVDGSKPVAADNFADWDSQFFITWDESKATEAGDKLQLKMKVKADKPITFGSQVHKAPGAYVFWYGVGDISATTEWTEFVSSEVDVLSGDPGWGKTAAGCWTIAFNLAKGQENTIYFDDMVVYVIKPTGFVEEHKIVLPPADGVLYNFAGQQVSESYKGFVIKDGKKFYKAK